MKIHTITKGTGNQFVNLTENTIKKLLGRCIVPVWSRPALVAHGWTSRMTSGMVITLGCVVKDTKDNCGTRGGGEVAV